MHVAPSRTLYGRGSKALWRFCGDLVTCMRGVRGQPFSTPLYIYRYICIRECGSTLYVEMAQGVSFSLYIGIGAKF